MVAGGWKRHPGIRTVLPVVLLTAAAVLATLPARPAGAVSHSAVAAGSEPTLAALRAEVERTGRRLAAATAAWERGQQQLGILVQRKIAAGREAEQLHRDAAAAHDRVDTLASSLYRNPVDPLLTAVMSGDSRTLADVIMMRRALGQTSERRQADAALLAERVARTRSLVAGQDAAASAAIRLQAQLEDQLDGLQRDAQASLFRVRALEALIKQRNAAARRVVSASCSAGVTVEAVNGFLPGNALCALRTAPGHRLVAPAAAAFDAMSTAFAGRFGKALCVTDSYRDYAAQVQVFRNKPNLAATPGRSQHGWGRAVDLCGGVQSYGTPPYVWLKQNASQFGFVHPDWAEPDGSRPEPWHWEFQG